MERSLQYVYQKISTLFLIELSQKISPRQISRGFLLIRNNLKVFITKKHKIIFVLPYEIKELYPLFSEIIHKIIYSDYFNKLLSDFINYYFNSKKYIYFNSYLIFE